MNDVTVFGLPVEPLEQNTIPLDVVVLVKTLDPDGEISISIRHTKDISVWDRVGLLTIALDVARQHATECFIPSDDNNDDDT